jgi:hypothetical protein
MKERIIDLRVQILDHCVGAHKEMMLAITDLVYDLAHKVNELEPELLTEEDIREQMVEYDRRCKREARDKLAKELAERVIDDAKLFPMGITVLHINKTVEQAKELLDAFKEP